MAIANRNLNLAVNFDSRRAVHGLRALDQGLRGVGLQADATRVTLAAMVGILGAGTIITNAVSEVGNFTEELAKSTTIAGATEYQYAQLEKQYRQLAKTAPQTATEIASGATFLGRAGLKADAVMGSLKDTMKLAEIGFIDTAEAANRATNIMTAFGIEVEDFGRTVDILAVAASSANVGITELGEGIKFSGSTAKSANVTFEETTAALSALGNAGLASGVAGRGLNQLFIGLAKADQIVNGSMLPALEGYYQLSKTMSENDFVSYVFDNLTTNAGRALLALIEQRDKMYELIESFEDAEGASDKMAESIRLNLNYEFNILNSNIAEAYLTFNEFVDLPGIVRGVTSAVQYLTENMQVLVDTVKAAGYVFATLITTLTAAKGLKLINSLLNGIHGLIMRMTSVAGRSGFVEMLKLFGKRALMTGLTFLLTSLTRIAKFGPTAIAALVAFRDTFRASSSHAIRQLGNALEAMVRTIQDLVSIWFPNLGKFTFDFDSLMERFASVLTKLIDAMFGLLDNVNALLQSIPYRIPKVLGGKSLSTPQQELLDRNIEANKPLHARIGELTAQREQVTGFWGKQGEAHEGLRQMLLDKIADEQFDLAIARNSINSVDQKYRAEIEANINKSVGLISKYTKELGVLERRVAGIDQQIRNTTALLRPESAGGVVFSQYIGSTGVGPAQTIYRQHLEDTTRETIEGPGGPTPDTAIKTMDQIRRSAMRRYATQPLDVFQTDWRSGGADKRTLADIQAGYRMQGQFNMATMGYSDANLRIANDMYRITQDILDLETATTAEKQKGIQLALEEVTAYHEVINAFEQRQENMRMLADIVTGSAQTLADGLISAFTAGENAAQNMADTIKDTMKNMVRDVLSQLARIGLAKIGDAIVGGAPAGSTLASLFDPTGNLFKNNMGGSYTVKGSGSGEVPVRMWATPGETINVSRPGRGGGGSPSINNNINVTINGPASRSEVEAGINRALPRISQASYQMHQKLNRYDNDFAVGVG